MQTVEKRIKSHGFVIVLHDIKGLLCVLMKYAASNSYNHVRRTLLMRLKRLFFSTGCHCGQTSSIEKFWFFFAFTIYEDPITEID